jgi:hypothetical protein
LGSLIDTVGGGFGDSFLGLWIPWTA